MNETKHLPFALFCVRISIGLVFFIWAADKFLRPDHAAIVFPDDDLGFL